MDLGTVRQKLGVRGYPTPIDLCKDVRLVFSNSKSYNTNKRSRVCNINICAVCNV